MDWGPGGAGRVHTEIERPQAIGRQADDLGAIILEPHQLVVRVSAFAIGIEQFAAMTGNIGETRLPELAQRVMSRAARRERTLDALLPIALAAIAIYPKARDVASDGAGIVGALVDVVDERREPAGPRLVGGRSEEHTSELPSLMRLAY